MRAAVGIFCFVFSFTIFLFYCFSYKLTESFQICDMVTVARFLNLTLVVPELDKTSFWSDPRYFPFLEKANFFHSYICFRVVCLLHISAVILRISLM